MGKNGSLFVVATPIGNLGDTTQRAVEVLRDVFVILSEDTRETRKLLDAFDITTNQLSYRDQNHNKVVPEILSLLSKGKNIALVSDSGTPLISDPGFKLVREVVRKGFDVLSVPGPSAVIAALSISGLPTDKFCFLGFLPKGRGEREKILAQYKKLDVTLVLYESPYKVGKLLEQIQKVLGNRYVCLCAEITKIHERCIRGFVESLIPLTGAQKGEFVVLVAKEGFSLDV